MTYSVGGSIQATDYNTFATTANNIGNIFCIGSSDQGYGQLSNGFTTIQTVSNAVAPTGTVTAQQWNWIIEACNISRKHQTGASYSNISNVQASTALNTGAAADGVIYATVDQNGTRVSLETIMTDATTNRRNAALQGSTAITSAVNNTQWRDFLTFTTTISFASSNQARYFFNAGGQIGISLVHGASGQINDVIADLCNELGTIWLSSGTCTLAGTAYTGLTKLGGVAARTTINTGLSFYALTSSNQLGVTQGTDVVYKSYGGSFININYRYSAPTLTITTTIDETFTSGSGTNVGTPTTLNVSVRQPETTNLTTSWGTVSPSTSISRA